mmetsp:Transcript_12736/g.20821  ORF Transcript_12736/g.20821 Transcript_12736/m.20821 type:complete len:214 (-) Transcript_12736:188-829(-)
MNSNRYCTWRIDADSGTTIRIVFTSFVTEEKDGVFVYDGLSEDPDAVLLHASGDRTRGTSVVLTNSNDALVIFTSGDYDVRSGFTAIAYADNGPLATLYDEPEFQGASILLQGRGLHNLMDRSVTRKASALRVSAGYSVTFFKDASLVGGNRTFTSDTANIGAFDNIATYAVVDRLVCSGVQNITATARGEPFSSNTQPEYELKPLLHMAYRR